jgi:hypothetical protein
MSDWFCAKKNARQDFGLLDSRMASIGGFKLSQV